MAVMLKCLMCFIKMKHFFHHTATIFSYLPRFETFSSLFLEYFHYAIAKRSWGLYYFQCIEHIIIFSLPIITQASIVLTTMLTFINLCKHRLFSLIVGFYLSSTSSLYYSQSHSSLSMFSLAISNSPSSPRISQHSAVFFYLALTAYHYHPEFCNLNDSSEFAVLNCWDSIDNK